MGTSKIVRVGGLLALAVVGVLGVRAQSGQVSAEDILANTAAIIETLPERLISGEDYEVNSLAVRVDSRYGETFIRLQIGDEPIQRLEFPDWFGSLNETLPPDKGMLVFCNMEYEPAYLNLTSLGFTPGTTPCPTWSERLSGGIYSDPPTVSPSGNVRVSGAGVPSSTICPGGGYLGLGLYVTTLNPPSSHLVLCTFSDGFQFFAWVDETHLILAQASGRDSAPSPNNLLVLDTEALTFTDFGHYIWRFAEVILLGEPANRLVRVRTETDPYRCYLNIVDFNTLTATDIGEPTDCEALTHIQVNEDAGVLTYLRVAPGDAREPDRVITLYKVALNSLEVVATSLSAMNMRINGLSDSGRYITLTIDNDPSSYPETTDWASLDDEWHSSEAVVFDLAADQIVARLPRTDWMQSRSRQTVNFFSDDIQNGTFFVGEQQTTTETNAILLSDDALSALHIYHPTTETEEIIPLDLPAMIISTSLNAQGDAFIARLDNGSYWAIRISDGAAVPLTIPVDYEQYLLTAEWDKAYESIVITVIPEAGTTARIAGVTLGRWLVNPFPA